MYWKMPVMFTNYTNAGVIVEIISIIFSEATPPWACCWLNLAHLSKNVCPELIKIIGINIIPSFSISFTF